MLLVFGKAVECAERCDFQIKTFATLASVRFLGLMSQRSLTFVLQKGHQVAQINLFPVTKLLVLRPHDEFVQQAGVRALGMFGLAAFVAEVLKEVLNERLHGSL